MTSQHLSSSTEAMSTLHEYREAPDGTLTETRDTTACCENCGSSGTLQEYREYSDGTLVHVRDTGVCCGCASNTLQEYREYADGTLVHVRDTGACCGCGDGEGGSDECCPAYPATATATIKVPGPYFGIIVPLTWFENDESCWSCDGGRRGYCGSIVDPNDATRRIYVRAYRELGCLFNVLLCSAFACAAGCGSLPGLYSGVAEGTSGVAYWTCAPFTLHVDDWVDIS
jgi:hypothetical protein